MGAPFQVSQLGIAPNFGVIQKKEEERDKSIVPFKIQVAQPTGKRKIKLRD